MPGFAKPGIKIIVTPDMLDFMGNCSYQKIGKRELRGSLKFSYWLDSAQDLRNIIRKPLAKFAQKKLQG
jgi:hypothetical protein